MKSNPYIREQQRRVMERAKDPNWPRCRACNEPLTKTDIKYGNTLCYGCAEGERMVRRRNREDGYIP